VTITYFKTQRLKPQSGARIPARLKRNRLKVDLDQERCDAAPDWLIQIGPQLNTAMLFKCVKLDRNWTSRQRRFAFKIQRFLSFLLFCSSHHSSGADEQAEDDRLCCAAIVPCAIIGYHSDKFYVSLCAVPVNFQ